MKARSPLHDRSDPHLAHRLIANMKQRHEGLLPPATIERDLRLLEEEVTYAEQRAHVLKERSALAGNTSAGSSYGANAQVFSELLQETEQELYRLYNARQFLMAEKMMNDGLPKEEIAAVLEMGDSSHDSMGRRQL